MSWTPTHRYTGPGTNFGGRTLRKGTVLHVSRARGRGGLKPCKDARGQAWLIPRGQLQKL